MIRDAKPVVAVVRLWLAVAILASCASSQGAQYRTVSGLSQLPNESLEDWVSYGDAVVVVTIASEDGESELSLDEVASGEGMTVRHLTADVGRAVWARDGLEDVLPRSVQVDGPGYLYSNGEKTPYVLEDGVRLEVGERYLMPIADFDAGGWQPIGFGIALADGRLSAGAADGAHPPGDDPLASEELTGLTIDDAATKLAAARPDPVASRHAALDPLARYAEVVTAREARAGERSPAPGES